MMTTLLARRGHLRRLPGFFPILLVTYGAGLILLQTEAPIKLLHGLVGCVDWIGAGFTGLPIPSKGYDNFDKPLRELYRALTLHTPVLPWFAWAAGALLLLLKHTHPTHPAHPVSAPLIHSPLPTAGLDQTADQTSESKPLARAGSRLPLFFAFALLVLILATGVGAWLRGIHLLPPSPGRWPASNFDEMVYYTQTSLFTQGAFPYRDTFMAHPPGVILAFTPALLFERAWGGAAAFVAARQWLLLYSLLAVPLAWLCGRKLGGPFSASLAAFVVALDGKAAFAPQSDVNLPNIGVLETLANLAALCALALYLYAPDQGPTPRRKWWLLGAGAATGISALCKLPGLALLLALLLYSICTRRHREALWILVGSVGGIGLLALPFFLAAPGQMLRQSLFFQMLRPQEVRAGVDQAARIALYPEAQVTLLLAGLGITIISLRLARPVWQMRASAIQGPIGSTGSAEIGAHSAYTGYTGKAPLLRWALPVLWAAPLAAIFLLGRSYHSQYYAQWVPPLALAACVLVAKPHGRPLVTTSSKLGSRLRAAGTALLGVALLPLLVAQWQATTSLAYDPVYRRTGVILRADPALARGVMAFDPGYTFAAGLPPQRIPIEGDYIVDTAGYSVYIAEEMDRRPWTDLLGSALQFSRERDEAAILARPQAQAALLAGALDADGVVLDQKIALPKLTPQSVYLLQGLAISREDVAFATLLRQRPFTSTHHPALNLTLTASYLAILGNEASPLVGDGVINATAKDVLQVGLYWRPTNYPAGNYRIVVSLVGPGGNSVRQVDTEPSVGADHTASWRPGLVYPDIRNIPLEALAPARYTILVRVYDPATNVTGQEMRLAAVEVR